MVKLSAPLPSLFAAIVTVPEPAFTAPERVTLLGEVIKTLPPVVVRLRTVLILPGLNGAAPEEPTSSEILPVPELRFPAAPKVMSPVPALRFAAVAAESFAVSEIFPLFVLTLAFTLISRPACMVIPTPALVIAMALVTVMSLLACNVTLAAAALIVAGAMVWLVAGVSEN